MPLLYPNSDDEKISAIRLYRSPRVGARGFRKLMEKAENFEQALEICVERARETGDREYKLASADIARREYEKGHEMGAHFLAFGAPAYPELLTQSEDAPPFLWMLGDETLLEKPPVAVIGTRNASVQGVRFTHNIVKLLSYQGAVIVSGLARGIDAAAHEAALTGGTIGVVAGGVDVFYPKQNSKLQALMSEHGLVLSEMPFGYQPVARDFPRRNRIIAGLSLGVLVIEGNLRSGTKLTVNDANALGRVVMAVPGHPLSTHAVLGNEMIKDGASLVSDVDDILNLIPELRSGEKAAPAETFATRPKIPPPISSQSTSALGRALIDGDAVQMANGRIERLD